MSIKSQLYPLSCTLEVWPAQNLSSSSGQSLPIRKFWSAESSQATIGLVRSRMVLETRSSQAYGVKDREKASREDKENRAEVDPHCQNYKDKILGIGLAVVVSASFWTGVGLTVARLMH